MAKFEDLQKQNLPFLKWSRGFYQMQLYFCSCLLNWNPKIYPNYHVSILVKFPLIQSYFFKKKKRIKLKENHAYQLEISALFKTFWLFCQILANIWVFWTWDHNHLILGSRIDWWDPVVKLEVCMSHGSSVLQDRIFMILLNNVEQLQLSLFFLWLK